MRYKGIETICLFIKGVRPPPQISAEAKKLGGGLTARKSPIGEG